MNSKEVTCHWSSRGVSLGGFTSKFERLSSVAVVGVSEAPHLHSAPRKILNWWPKAIRLISQWHFFHPSPRTCLSGQFISQPLRLLKFSSKRPQMPYPMLSHPQHSAHLGLYHSPLPSFSFLLLKVCWSTTSFQKLSGLRAAGWKIRDSKLKAVLNYSHCFL